VVVERLFEVVVENRADIVAVVASFVVQEVVESR
jgi:hypothetical protein